MKTDTQAGFERLNSRLTKRIDYEREDPWHTHNLQKVLWKN